MFATLADPPDGPYQHATQRWQRSSTVPANFVLDPSALAPIEFISPVEVSVPERPVLTYGIAPSGTPGKCVHATLFWDSTVWIDTRKLETTGVFQVPEFPSSLAEFAPTPDSTFVPSVTGVSHSLPDSECADRPTTTLATWARNAPSSNP